MFCTNCGKENKDTDSFCVHCGTPIKVAEAPVEEVMETISVEQVTPVEEVAETPAEEVVEEIAIEEDAPAEEVMEAISVEDIAPFEVEMKETVEEIQEPAQPEEIIQPVDDVIPEIVEETTVVEPAIEVEVADEVSEAEIVEETQPEETAPEKEIKPKKKKGFFAYVGLIFSYVGMTVLLTSLILSIFAKITVDGKQFSADLKKIDVIDIEVGELVKSDVIDFADDDTIQDVIYKSLMEYSNLDITKSEVEEMYNETNFKDVLAEKAGAYVDFVVSGDELEEVTAEEVYDIVDENRAKIEDIAKVKITDEHMDYLMLYLENEGSEVMEVLTAKGLEEKLDDAGITTVTAFTRNWIVYTAMAGLLILIILLAIAIFKMNKNAGASFAYLGSIFIVIGILLIGTGTALFIVKEKIVSLFGNSAGVFEAVLPVLRDRIMLFGVVTFGVGLITILIKTIVCAIAKKARA